MSDAKIRMAVLLSGSGRTLQNFIDRSAAGRLAAGISGVISSRAGVRGLELAERAGIRTCVISRNSFRNTGEFSRKISETLHDWSPDLTVMAGFLSFFRIPDRLENRVMNIHPALLPAFGGKGYYGDRVHKAVLDYGCKVTGCTVHFANNKYDHGPIILQKAVPVRETDDAHCLAGRVFEAEKELYPEAVNLFAAGRLRVTGRKVNIIPERG